MEFLIFFLLLLVCIAVVAVKVGIEAEIRQIAPLVAAVAERQIKAGTGDVRGDIAVLTARVAELEQKQKALVAVLREVVQETAGDVLDNDQGMPIRRVRGVRAALWRLEMESAKEQMNGE